MDGKENISSMSDIASDLGELKLSSSSPFRSSPQRKPLISSNTQESPAPSSDGTLSQFNLSPRKGTSSRVIESLHSEIDTLKAEVAKLQVDNGELKKRTEVIQKRKDQLAEQLSNAKHENETINSLLERKERKISDLEEQLIDVNSSSSVYKHNLESLQSKFEEIRDKETTLSLENERLKVAYDIVVASQKEYRAHYNAEIKQLQERLQKFTAEKHEEITKNIGLINKSDATIYRSIKSVTLRSSEIEEKYTQRDQVSQLKLEDLKQIVEKNDQTTETLLKLSKDLFHEIAQKHNIDKEELLQQYLDQNPNTKSPFEKEPEVETVNQELSIEPEEQDTATEKLTVKKRHERVPSLSKQDERSVSVEERITSLGKELNSMIPQKDRTAKVERISSKSNGHSRHSSRVIDSASIARSATTASSATNSRRSSKIFDNNITVIESAGTDLASRIGVPSQNENDNISNETSGKSKRKRRRRRGKKSSSNIGDDSHGEGDFSGNEK